MTSGSTEQMDQIQFVNFYNQLQDQFSFDVSNEASFLNKTSELIIGMIV